MAVVFDVVQPSSSGQRATSSTTLNWTHTTVAAATCVLVQVQVDGGGPVNNTSTCTIGGVSMTQLVVQQAAAAGEYIVLYGSTSFALAAGAHAIVFTPQAAPVDMCGASLSFSGAVSFGTPVSASSGAGTASSMTSPNLSTTGSQNYVAHFGAAGDAINTSPATNEWVNNVTAGGGHSLGNGSGGIAAATGGIMTFTWQLNSTTNWADAVVEIQAPAIVGPQAILYPFPSNRVVTVPFFAGVSGYQGSIS